MRNIFGGLLIRLDTVTGNANNQSYRNEATKAAMKSQAQIIQATVKSPYMQAVIAKHGWSEQVAAEKVVEYLTCGKPTSLYDFMEADVASGIN